MRGGTPHREEGRSEDDNVLFLALYCSGCFVMFVILFACHVVPWATTQSKKK